MQKINGTQIKDFLVDIEENSETILLEEGKEKDDLIQSAKKRGILLIANSMDLGVFKTIFGFTNQANANGAILPEDEFIKVFPQIVGRPVNVGHQRKLIVGFYTDYKYIAKKKQAIAYGIFFKSVYPELWKKAISFQKDGLLSSSFEIWSPQKQRKILSDGTYELHNMQMAGGAFIFEENGELPAFKDAKVLALAKDMTKKIICKDCLVYASKYSDADIVTAETNAINREQIICKHCQKEFLPASLDQVQLTCPSCKSIVDRKGEVIHPPQIKDYSATCPKCGGDFTILKTGDLTQDVQCNGCGNEYMLEFYSAVKPEALELVNFLYESESTCPQCGNVQCIDTFADADEHQIKCKKCGVSYPFKLKVNTKRKIKKITGIKKQVVKNPIEKEDDIVKSKKLADGIKKLAGNYMKIRKELEEAKKILKTASFSCECVKCGYKHTGSKHCADLTCPKCKAQMRRVSRPGAGAGTGRGAGRDGRRLNRVMMIARELKGLLNASKSEKILKDQEFNYTVKTIDKITEESNSKDEIIEKAKAETQLYKANAQKILERRQTIGDLAKDMTDEQVLDEKDYEIAMLKKEKNEVVTPAVANEAIGESKKLHTAGIDPYAKDREAIDNIAFPKIK